MSKIIVLSRLPLASLQGAGLRVLTAYLKTCPWPVHNVYWEEAPLQKDDAPPFSREKISLPIHSSLAVLGSRAAYHRFREEKLEGQGLVLALPDSLAESLAMSFCAPAAKSVIYIMDNFLAQQSLGFFFPKRFALAYLLRHVLQGFAQVWAISPFMQKQIEHEIGVNVQEVFLPLRDHPHGPIKVPSHNAARILYIGTSKAPYREGLAALASAPLAKEGWSLDIFGESPPDAQILENPAIRYRGAFGEEDRKIDYAQYDLAFLCYSFDRATRALMRESFPSKLADYVAAGLPVWSLLPAELEIANFLHEKAIGPISHSPAEVGQALKGLRRNLSQHGKDFAQNVEKLRRAFDFEKNSKLFEDSCRNLLSQ
jgi:hypothetical protein